MNYDQQHHAAGGYPMPSNPYAQQPPPPSQQHPQHPQHPQHQHQHRPSAAHHHAPPPNQLPQLPPISYPPPAPVPSNMASNMAINGITLPSAPSAPGASAPPSATAPKSTGELPSISKLDDFGRKFRLEVVQQPQRARMCGFGDKDRRPITPPPCVKVHVFDPRTGAIPDVNAIDHEHLIVHVDLWNEAGDQEVNLVRHTSNTSSISTTTLAGYHDIRNDVSPYAQLMPHYNGPGVPYGHQQQPSTPQYHYQGYQPPPQGYQSTNSAFAPPTQYYPQQASSTVPSQADIAYGQQRGSMSMAAAQPQGMFTRNLIGSLTSSAFRLNDTEDNVGVWFVLQDLSVRTEGHFRLRFTCVSVAKRASQPSAGYSAVNMGKSPVLAQCFSDVFQVYSAKKFPGVCESTLLSKCFAGQGIKIPIRKEGASDKKGNDDDEDF